MANNVSELSKEELEKLKRPTPMDFKDNFDNSLREIYGKWEYGGLGPFEGLAQSERPMRGSDPRRAASINLFEGTQSEPQLMQDWKMMEQAKREVPIRAANYWSQAAENFANGNFPDLRSGRDYPSVPQAPTLSNVSLDFSGQPTPQAPQAQAPQGRVANFTRTSPTLGGSGAYPTAIPNMFGANMAYTTPEDYVGVKFDTATPLYEGLDENPSGKFTRGSLPDIVERNTRDIRGAGDALLGRLQDIGRSTAKFVTGQEFGVPSISFGNQSRFAQDAPTTNAVSQGQPAVNAPVSQGNLGIQIPASSELPVVNPFNGELMVNAEQFLTAEEAQAKAEKEKYAGMTYDQMQMAMAQERTQLADNAQAASTASPTAPTQPSSFATSQGAATTVGGQDLGSWLRSGQAPVEGQQTPSMTPQAPVSKFEQESANREARIEQNFGNGRAVSDRERRGTGEMSMEAAVRMAGGDRDKARQMIELQRQGRDPVTGKLSDSGALTLEQQISVRRQNLAEKSFDYNVAKDSKKLYDESIVLAKEASTQEEKDAAVGKGLSSSVKDMRDVMKRAAGRLDQFFSTGMAGKAASFWKGSDADAQESDFAFLKSNVALNAMMELKSNSPTGSTGFGALNTEELKTLQNQFATLDPFTSPELVQKNLKQLNDRFEGIIQSAYDKHKAKYGDEAANRVYGSMIGGNTSGQSSQPQANAVTYSDGSNYEFI